MSVIKVAGSVTPTDFFLKFPGYPSSTKVENKLKKSAKLVASDKKSKARSMQVGGVGFKSRRITS